jgi:hypothetical protein
VDTTALSEQTEGGWRLALGCVGGVLGLAVLILGSSVVLQGSGVVWAAGRTIGGLACLAVTGLLIGVLLIVVMSGGGLGFYDPKDRL